MAAAAVAASEEVVKTTMMSSSSVVVALGDRGEGVGAECPPEADAGKARETASKVAQENGKIEISSIGEKQIISKYCFWRH